MEIQKYEKYMDQGVELAMTHGPKLILAVLTLVIGSILISAFSKFLESTFKKMKFDETLRPYLVGILSIILKLLLYISVLGMIGVQTTSFIAVLGAAGLAIGLSLQGSLGNFAGGVLILVFKPIKKGDFIEACGVSGTVSSIQPFVTIVLSADNITHYIPNGTLSNGVIKNYSCHPERRLDLQFGISYSDDIDKAKKVLKEIAEKTEKIHKHLDPQIFVASLGDNSVNISLRVFTTPKDYWDVRADLVETVKKTFDKEGISFPFPQRDVHIIKE